MPDARQLTLDDILERREESERLAAQTVTNTRAVRCPGCGEWVFDERVHKVCGQCGRRFRS